MPLFDYLQLTRRLLNDTTFARINEFDLFDFINIARGQIASDGECVRTIGSTAVAAGMVSIPLAQVVPEALPPGMGSPLVVRNAYLDGKRVDIRPWDWFAAYYFVATPNPPVIPTPVMAHQGQGVLSTLFFNSAGGRLVVDLVVLPVDLVDDGTPEAIPYPWTDAIPFYAAFYAYMAQERQDDANAMWLRYHAVMHRARATTTSTNLPENDPGGLGAAIATTKTALGVPPPQAPQGRGRGG